MTLTDELNLARSRVAELEAQLYQVLEHMPMAFAMVDKNMRYLSANQRWVDSYKLGDQAIIGKSHYELFPEIGDEWKAIYRRCLQGEVNANEQGLFEYGDGTAEWLRWEIRPWFIANDAVGGLLMFSEIITDKVKERERLRESEARYRLVVDQTEQMIYDYDVETGKITWSGAIEALSGSTAEEFASTDIVGWEEMIHPEDRGKVMTIMNEIMEKGGRFSVEYRWRMAGGQYIDVHDNGVFLTDAEGRAYRMLGAMRDVTEHKQADKALHESQQLLQMVLDTIPVRVFWKDKDGNYLGCNRLFAQDVGLNSPTAIIGKDDFELFPSQAADYRADDRFVINTRKAKINYEELQNKPDGTAIWLRTSKVPLYNSRHEAIGMLGTYEDITEQKEAELAFERISLLHESILNSAATSIISSDVDGVITSFNAAASRMLGYRPEEVIGKTTPEIFHDRNEVIAYSNLLTRELGHPVPPGYEVFVAKARLGMKDEKEWTYIAKDKTRHPVLLAVSAILSETGEITGFLGVGTDISQRKEAEAALRRSEARANGLLSAIPDLVFRLHRDGRFLDFRAPEGTILYIPPEHIIGNNINDLMPFISPQVMSLTEASLTTGQVQSFEYQLPRPDGAIGDYEARLIASGEDEVVALIREVTDRKAAEAERDRMVALVENTDVFIGIADLDGNALYINPAGMRQIGLDSYQGFRFSSFQQDVEQTDKMAIPVALAQGIWRGENVIERRDGTAFNALQTIFAIRNSEGQAYALGSIITDISEQQRQQEALRFSEERYRTLAANLPDVAVILFNHELRLLLVDGPEIERTGFSKAGMEGKLLHEVLPPEHVAVFEPLQRATLAGQTTQIELPFGEFFFALSYIPIWDEQGRVIHGLLVAQNITERKRAEEEIAIFRTLVENAADGIGMSDLQGNIVYGNPAYYELYGYDYAKQEMVGMGVSSFYEPDDLPTLRDEISPMIREGKPYFGEFKQRRKNGEKFDASFLLFMVKDGQGNPLRLAAVIRDVTAHKQAMLALEEQRQFLRQVIDASPSMIFVKDYHGKFVLANRVLAELYNTTVETIIGKSDADFAPNPDEVKDFLEADRQVIDSGEVLFITEEPVTNSRGEKRWFQTTKVPIISPDGKVRQVLGVATDITERKKAEIDLEEQRQFLRQVIDLSPDMIFVKDWDGHLVLVNQTVAGMFGKPIADLIGKTDMDFNPNVNEVKEFLAQDRQVMSSKQPLGPYEMAITNPVTGEVRYYQNWKVPIISPDGSNVQVLGLSTDITPIKQTVAERDQLIKELRTANRLAQESSRLKSEFLSTMSHELRTPLNAIEGFTSIMLSDMGAHLELGPKARHMIERVSFNSKRLLNLINDFLDLSRIESGRLELANRPFVPTSLAERWREQVGVLAEEKGIELYVEIDPTLPPELVGDEEAISKIALNLLTNAIKFTNEGSVCLSLNNGDRAWSIGVSDTGIGIPPHARDYIFDEFRQVDGSYKRLYGGTGLGLAIVKKMTHLMGGTVALQSEVGQGSTFTVTLPKQEG